MKDVAQTRAALAGRRRRVQIWYVIHTLLYGAALALGLLEHQAAAFAVGGGNMLLYFLFLRGQVRGYSAAVAQANVLHGLCAPLKEAAYTGREGLDTARFQALGLLPIRDHEKSLLVREGFEGRGFGLTLKGWEVSFHYPVYTGSRTDYRFLNGCVLTAEGAAAADRDGDWLLIRRGMVDEAAQAAFAGTVGSARCACPVEKLAEGFDIYSKTGKELPRQWAERLNRCFQQAGSLGAVRIAPEYAAVYLGNRFYTGRTKVRDLPNEERLLHCPLPERDAVWELFRFWAAAGKK